MLIVADHASPDPIYRQIADQIRSKIQGGALRPGYRLPTAAEPAETLDVNRNTALEAYRVLCDTGFIELRRGKGAVVLAQFQQCAATTDNEVDRLDVLLGELADLAT